MKFCRNGELLGTVGAWRKLGRTTSVRIRPLAPLKTSATSTTHGIPIEKEVP